MSHVSDWQAAFKAADYDRATKRLGVVLAGTAVSRTGIVRKINRGLLEKATGLTTDGVSQGLDTLTADGWLKPEGGSGVKVVIPAAGSSSGRTTTATEGPDRGHWARDATETREKGFEGPSEAVTDTPRPNGSGNAWKAPTGPHAAFNGSVIAEPFQDLLKPLMGHACCSRHGMYDGCCDSRCPRYHMYAKWCGDDAAHLAREIAISRSVALQHVKGQPCNCSGYCDYPPF